MDGAGARQLSTHGDGRRRIERAVLAHDASSASRDAHAITSNLGCGASRVGARVDEGDGCGGEPDPEALTGRACKWRRQDNPESASRVVLDPKSSDRCSCRRAPPSETMRVRSRRRGLPTSRGRGQRHGGGGDERRSQLHRDRLLRKSDAGSGAVRRRGCLEAERDNQPDGHCWPRRCGSIYRRPGPSRRLSSLRRYSIPGASMVGDNLPDVDRLERLGFESSTSVAPRRRTTSCSKASSHVSSAQMAGMRRGFL